MAKVHVQGSQNLKAPPKYLDTAPCSGKRFKASLKPFFGYVAVRVLLP